MSLTEVEHLRAEVARLEAELAAKVGPPPSGSIGEHVDDAVSRLDRSIEILTAILDGPISTIGFRLEAIGANERSSVEVGMVSMGMLAAPLLTAQAGHARQHGIECASVGALETVRSYAQATAAARQHLHGAAKAGG